MALGSVAHALIAFPGNRFNGDVVPALNVRVDNDTIHIIDLVCLFQDADGALTVAVI